MKTFVALSALLVLAICVVTGQCKTTRNSNSNRNDNSNGDFLSGYLNSMSDQQGSRKGKSGSTPSTPKILNVLQSPLNLPLPRPTTKRPTSAPLILRKLDASGPMVDTQTQQEDFDDDVDESFFDESDTEFSSQQDEFEDDDFTAIPASQFKFIQSLMDAQA